MGRTGSIWRPRFWTVLEEMSYAGLLACPELVYCELSDVQDDLADWAKKHKDMFVDPDATEPTNSAVLFTHDGQI